MLRKKSPHWRVGFLPGGLRFRPTTPDGYPPPRSLLPTFCRGNRKSSARRKTRRSQRQKIQRKQIMRNPTPYLKMRVLGAIDMAPGNSIQARIKAVSQMTFTDEDGQLRQFTWRTIVTWYSRYKNRASPSWETNPAPTRARSARCLWKTWRRPCAKHSPRFKAKPRRWLYSTGSE